jgi:hypothetical protein
MPWLFVDYDPGAGGERFCAKLSSSPQCKSANFELFPNGRTKINDDFGQEWLKIKLVNPFFLESDPNLFCVVPIHRTTELAEKTLGKISSIRIQNPTEINMIKKFKNDLINKVYLTTEPNSRYFLGLIKLLLNDCVDSNALLRLKYGTPTIDVYLTARGWELNDENRKKFIDEVVNTTLPEPNYKYDLIIKYEDLINNFNGVAQKIYEKFGIEIPTV